MSRKPKTPKIVQPQILRMSLADLRPDEENPRKITKSELAGLAASLEEFGMVQPIVWNKRSGKVVGGHQRLKVLLASGATETDVVVVDEPPARERALNVALNNPKIAGQFTEDLDAYLSLVAQDEPDLLAALRIDELLPVEGDEPDAGGDASDDVSEDLVFRVIVHVGDEHQQALLVERLEQEGYECQPLIS